MKIALNTSYGISSIPKYVEKDYLELKKQHPTWPMEILLGIIFDKLETNGHSDEDVTSFADGTFKAPYIKIKSNGIEKLLFNKVKDSKSSYGFQILNFDKFDLVNIDNSRPWTIEEYDGHQYIRYLDTKDYSIANKELNYFKKNKTKFIY